MLDELITRIEIALTKAKKEKVEFLKQNILIHMQLDIERALRLHIELVKKSSPFPMKNNECHICRRVGVTTENITQKHIFSNEKKHIDVSKLNAKNIFRMCRDCKKEISSYGIENCIDIYKK